MVVDLIANQMVDHMDLTALWTGFLSIGLLSQDVIPAPVFPGP